jgi:hypothetical protein
VLQQEVLLKEGVPRHESVGVSERVALEEDQPTGMVGEGAGEVTARLQPPSVRGVLRRNCTDAIRVIVHYIEVEEPHRRPLRIARGQGHTEFPLPRHPLKLPHGCWEPPPV